MPCSRSPGTMGMGRLPSLPFRLCPALHIRSPSRPFPLRIPLLRRQRVLQAPREGGHGEGGVPILRGGIREEPWNRGQRMVPAAEAVHLREAGGARGRRTEVQLQAGLPPFRELGSFPLRKPYGHRRFRGCRAAEEPPSHFSYPTYYNP